MFVGAGLISGQASRASENQPQLIERNDIAAPPGQTIANRINVLFRPGASPAQIAQLNASHGAVLVQAAGPSGVHSLELPTGPNVEATLRAYRNHPLVLEAGHALVLQLFAEPDDTNYAFQWHLHDTAGGVWAESAWNIATTAGSGVTVAVIDTGAPFENFTRPASPGLPEMVFSPAPDLAGTNFVAPWNFVHDDAHPNDDHGHGSHVIGTIRQTTNNAYGVAGVAHGASIMPIKVLDYQGSGQDADLNDAIIYATDQGADIISMSLGFPGTGAPDGNGIVCGEIVGLNAAIDYAAANGVVLIAAAGNDGGTIVSCPAANPHVIAVGATRFDAQVSYYSNHGSELDVVAPGGDPNVDQNADGFSDGVVQETYCLPGSFIILQGIFSGTAIFDGFCDVFMSGTSMATPHVAGIAALLLGEDSSLSPAQVRFYLESTARDGSVAGWDPTFGWGLVDANAALIALTGGVPPTAIVPPPTATTVPPTATPTPDPSTFYFSLADDQSFGGVAFADEDIVFFDGTGFSLYFDGSNVGLAGLNLNAFTLPDTGGILLSFSAAASIPGIGTVDDSDIVLFTATSLGNVTAGSFSLYFDGSDVGLTRKQEGIDGIAVLRFPVSEPEMKTCSNSPLPRSAAQRPAAGTGTWTAAMCPSHPPVRMLTRPP